MATIVREERFIKSDYKNNNNKFWYIRQYDDHSVVTEFGRVGSNSQSRSKPFSSEAQATTFLEKKCKEKQRAGRNGEIAYRKLNTVEGTGSAKVVETSNLAQIAKEDISFNSPEVEKLLAKFTKLNIHNITNNIDVTYNKQTGLFETPCGIVTGDGIDKARLLLSDIGKFVESNDLTSKQYGELINDYLMIIPQNIGRRLDPTTLYTSQDDIYKQNDILDSLEASYQKVLTIPTDDDSTNEPQKREKLFSVDLNLLEDGKLIDRVIKKYNDTKSGMHVSSSLKVKKVYTVSIETMLKAFEQRGKPLGNISELWHGTRVSNILSILKGGLVVPPSTASHVCGRMWGTGVYAASSSSKSLNYSYGYWDGKGSDNNCFMFLMDVSMGKEYFPKRGESWNYTIPKGYDSTWATVKNTGLKSDEMIVPNTYQCNLTYLIEFCK